MTITITRATPYRGRNLISTIENNEQQLYEELTSTNKLTIESPILNFKFEIEYSNEIFVKEIISICVNFYNEKTENEEISTKEFAISARTNKVPILLDNQRLINSYYDFTPNVNFLFYFILFYFC